MLFVKSIGKWRVCRESNSDPGIRNPLFYPLNYRPKTTYSISNILLEIKELIRPNQCFQFLPR
jgi:hypothetical protein